ncbi:unnamed protein product [Cylindrotheca closterium]|uniref:VASt domain-containing protein n=1 Tax=Cylindrotheca closterium TaxID=2856 RepID=A0AAD2FG84_9STRA|nr:unnamed protein product [Cylindrotheca closterium]
MSKVSTNQKSFLNRKEVDKSLASNIDDVTRAVGGFICDEFDCVHNNFTGKLYTGPSAILFTGRIFFFDWCQRISWMDVVQVKKKKRSVDIVVKEPKGTTFTFDNFFDPDRVWSSLVDLHSDSILDTPPKPATPRELSRSLRRNNSDPFSLSQAAFTFEKETNRESEDLQVLSTVSTEESIGNSSVTDDLSWISLLNDATSYSQVAVKDLELKCSLDTFFDLFISDSAKLSIPKYMQGSGEENVYSSSWKENDSLMTRVVEYSHPVNAPMAPPLAKARKEQSYRKYGRDGVALETKTIVEDVPMTDCFYVVDQIRVAAMGDKVFVTMVYDIRFVKSTMFKGIITRTTKADMEKSLQGLAAFMSKSLHHDGDTVLSLTKSSPPQQESQDYRSVSPASLQSFLSSTVLFLLFVFQLYIIWTLVCIQHDIAKLVANSLGHTALQDHILLESARVFQ